MPILICAAVTVSQGPPAPRYLFPLQGVISIWTALYLEKVRNDSKILFVLALTTWCLFSSVWIYKYYLKIGIVNNSSIVKKTSPYNNVIEYCKENNIYHAYSDYSTSIVSTFLSKGEVTIAEYSKKVFLQKLKRELDTEKKFSIIVSEKKALNTYMKYLNENIHSYSKNIVKEENDNSRFYYIFSNFKGSPEKINKLRSLIINQG